MKQMKVFLIAVLIFVSAGLCAQDQKSVQLIPYKHAIRFNPLRLAFREIGIGYEFQVRESAGIEIRPGFIYPSEILDEYFERWANSPNMKFKGLSLLSQIRFYKPGKKKNGFRNLNFSFGYRYFWFTDESLFMRDPDGYSYSNELYLSQWRNDLVLLIGQGYELLTQHILNEFEINFGARISFLHTKVSGCRFCQGAAAPPGISSGELIEQARSQLRPEDGISGMLQVSLSYHFGMVW